MSTQWQHGRLICALAVLIRPTSVTALGAVESFIRSNSRVLQSLEYETTRYKFRSFVSVLPLGRFLGPCSYLTSYILGKSGDIVFSCLPPSSSVFMETPSP